MDHSIIEDLLKNKFVLRKTTGKKFAVHRLGEREYEFPVMIEVLDDRIFMYRDRISFYKSYMMHTYNTYQFINNYYELLQLDVHLEMMVRSLYYTPFTMRFVIRRHNQINLMKCSEFEKKRIAVQKIKNDFMSYIKQHIDDPDYLKNPELPQEFKAFIKNSAKWAFMCTIHTMALDAISPYLQERLLRKFIQLRKTQGITYESVA